MPDVTSSGEDRDRTTTPEQTGRTRVNPVTPVSPVDPVHKDTTVPGAGGDDPTTGREARDARDTFPGGTPGVTGTEGRTGAGAADTTTGREARDARDTLPGGTPGVTGTGTGTGSEERTGADADTTRTDTPHTPSAQPHSAADRSHGPQGSPLLPHEECDELASRLHHAVAGFVDRPRDAVEEADHVLEELAARFTEAVNDRRRTLRGSWQLAEGGGAQGGRKGDTAATAVDTEQLRLALRDYRELTERLLHV
ncbi:hypothetical protein [Streptomyces sp. NPDC088254]|uniref:hypothetical protein n=1 Tax=Streptomyces sp. NPDC088254 TaxID=3365847 RepID=UPI0037FD57F3